MKNTYNGWTNYETWLAALWIDNDEGSQTYWHEQTAFILSPEGISEHRPSYTIQLSDEEIALLALTEQLKENHEAIFDTLEGFPADLMRAAFDEINWREIAQSMIDEAKDTCQLEPS